MSELVGLANAIKWLRDRINTMLIQIVTGAIKASGANGLSLVDKDGNLGIFIADGGNVYVGGDSPQVGHQFDVLGDTSGTNQVIFGVGNLNTTDPTIYFQAGNGIAVMNSRRNHPLVLRVNNIDRIYIDTSGNVGINDSSPDGKLDVAQTSTTAAIPVLELQQADLSEEFINFVSTVGTDNPIEAIGSKTLTTTHFIRIQIDGVGYRYIPVGTIA